MSLIDHNRMKEDPNVLKIAVCHTDNPYKIEKGQVTNWHLFEFNRNKSLSSLVNDVVKYPAFNLNVNENYALLYVPDEKDHEKSPFYVVEDNRNEIFNGIVLYIYYSSTRVVEMLMHEHENATEQSQRLETLKKLLWHASDPLFVFDLENKNGSTWIMNLIANNGGDDEELTLTKEELAFLLEIFMRIMEHDIIQWGSIERSFVSEIAKNILKDNEQTNATILVHSLSILEMLIVNCHGKVNLDIENQITLPKLQSLLKDSKSEVQHNTLALINALLAYSDSNVKKSITATLNSKKFKETINKHVLSSLYSKEKDFKNERQGANNYKGIMHQMYVLQTLLLKSVYEDRFVSGESIEKAKEKVLEIRNNFVLANERDGFDSKPLFRSQSSLHSSSSNGSVDSYFSEDFERLGFDNVYQPWEIFQEKPGALVLDLLVFFSKKQEHFIRFIIENSSPSDKQYNCPLVMMSFRLTQFLCGLLGIGKVPCDDGREFYQMLFDSECPLEQFFTICLSLCNRTWHEIHATIMDIDIVSDFLKEKLRKTLQTPRATESFENFQKELSKITYNEINKHWLEDKMKRDQRKFELPAIKELKSLLYPQIMEVVKQHRLNHLTRGTQFDKYTNKGQRIKDKYWVCRLSSNKKTLLYGDFNEDHSSFDEALVNKFNISDTEHLVTGKDCPHMKDAKGKKGATSLAFALIASEDCQVPSLTFVASNNKEYSYWLDGLSALLGKPMVSEEAEKDVNKLLELDIKLRLLDIEGLNIPEKAPIVPPSPPNYDFQFKSNSLDDD